MGAHLARTAAQIAPFAAPIHCLLALWTWGDAKYTGAEPFFWSKDLFFSASAATWPLALALVCCVIRNVVLRVPLTCSSTCSRAPGDDGRPGDSDSKRSSRRRSPWASPLPRPGRVRRNSSFERTNSWNRLPTWNRSTSFTQGASDDEGLGTGDGDGRDRRDADDSTRGNLVGKHPPWKDAKTIWEQTGILHSYDIFDDPHPLLRTRHLIRRTSVLSSTTASSAASVLALLAEENSRHHRNAEDGLSTATSEETPTSNATSRSHSADTERDAFESHETRRGPV